MLASSSPVRLALSHASIRRTTFAFAAITLGEWVLGTSLAIHAYSAAGALAVGLIGARFVPAALASVLFSHLADRRAPTRVLASIGVLRAASAGVALACLEHGAPIGALVAAAWVDASIGAAYRPAQARLLPAVARSPQELASATALASMAKSSGQIVGALGGSVLLVFGGAPGAVGVAAALFLGSTVATGRVPVPSAPGPSAAARSSAWHRVRSGIGAIGAAAGATRVAAWSGARSLLRGVWTSLGVLASLALLHMGQGGYGILMAAAGAGTLTGIALSGRLVGRRALAFPLAASLGVAGLAVACVGAVAVPWVAAAAMAAWGIGMAVADVGAQALLARIVPPSDSARVVGVMEGGKLLAEGLGALLAPVAAEWAGLRETLIGAGCLMVAALACDRRGFEQVDRVGQGRVDLLNLARGVRIFGGLRMDGLEAVVAPLIVQPVSAGEVIVEQDSRGSRWYLVQDGRFDVLIDGFRTGSIGPGGAFGERGLMRGEARAATVRATCDGTLLALERADFLRALTGAEEDEVAALVAPVQSPYEVLRGQPLLHGVPDAELDALTAAIETFDFPAGATIFEQGDEDDRWLLVLDGDVEITVDGAVRRQLGRGDALGEIAVLHRVARTAAAIALTRCTILAVPGAALRRALPELAQTGLSPAGSA
jgi:CRP-like cAMP-binding protein/predicted MFS family arabinose efflux permease